MINRYPQYLILLFVIFASLNSCKPDDTDPCKTAVAPTPPTSNLVFRVFDAVTREDLYLTTDTAKRLYRDSFSASQPCSPYNPLAVDAYTYNIPTKTGPVKQGYVFQFLNLRNPSIDEAAECSTITLHWNKNDSDVVFWTVITKQNGACAPYKVLDQVYFNGIRVQAVFDTAYRYYPLYK